MMDVELTHSLILFAPSSVEHKATQQQVPSITVLSFQLNRIPSYPSQIFPFGFNGSPPSDLWSDGPTLAFRVPGELNSAVVIFLSPQNVTDPSPSSDLQSF